MMNKEEFVKVVKEELEMQLGMDYTILPQIVTKNNGVRLTGLTARHKSRKICPTVYIDEMYCKYQDGAPLCALCDTLVARIRNADTDVNLSFMNNRETFLKRVFYKLVNTRDNLDHFTADKIIYEESGIDGLSKVYCLHVTGTNASGAIILNQSLLHMYGLERSEIIKAGNVNTPFIFKAALFPMDDVVAGLIGDSGDLSNNILDVEVSHIADCAMYILSNTLSNYGASCLCYPGLLDRIGEKLGDDFYVIPSSIHETILIPASFMVGASHFGEIIREVNDEHVAPEERLGDSLYFYSNATHKLSVA